MSRRRLLDSGGWSAAEVCAVVCLAVLVLVVALVGVGVLS